MTGGCILSSGAPFLGTQNSPKIKATPALYTQLGVACNQPTKADGSVKHCLAKKTLRSSSQDNHGDIAYRGHEPDGVAEYIGDHNNNGSCRLDGRTLQFCRRGLASRSTTGTATRPMPS